MSRGDEMHAVLRELYPICRSITGNGVRQTLDIMRRHAPLQRHEVASGTQVFDWTVPREWNVEDAYVADSKGRRVIDFKESNLHLLNYSVPFRGRLSRHELLSRLHSRPDMPDVVPYRTSYYRDDWGFNVRHADLSRFQDDYYDVCVDTSLTDGALTYGELLLPGDSDREVLFYSHVCHPSLANDNLSGLVVTLWLAKALAREHHRLSYRFVWGPGTIGSITWLARNEARLDRICFGLVAVLLGIDAPFQYKPTRRESATIDLVMAHLMDTTGGCVRSFDPYGYDERQFSSPGIDLPVGRLTRTPHGEYPEYHTSADNPALVCPDALESSLDLLLDLVNIFENDRRFVNQVPKCEPQLGRRGLYRTQGGDGIPQRELAMLWLLNQSDGAHSVLDIARRSKLPFEHLVTIAHELEAAGLLTSTDWRIESK